MTDLELNEAVASKLGWIFTPIPKDYVGYVRPMPWKTEKGELRWDCPAYSTSIEAAWEVVEFVANKLDPNGDVKNTAHPDGRMRFMGYGFRLEHHTENAEEKWICAFPEIVCAPPYEEMNDNIQAEADTAPRAICEAFLKLKEDKNESIDSH